MAQNINLKELEAHAWKSYFQDGLLDVFIGVMLITMALRSFTDNVWFTFLVFAGVLVLILGNYYQEDWKNLEIKCNQI